MISFLLFLVSTSFSQSEKPRTPGDEQYRKDIIQYTTDQCKQYTNEQLEKSRLVWLKKLSKNKCKRKLAIKPAEIKELCDELNVHLDIIQAEQSKRKKANH